MFPRLRQPEPAGWRNLNRRLLSGLTASWSYDAFGNRTSETFGGTSSVPLPMSSTAQYSDGTNHVTSSSLMSGNPLYYDAEGMWSRTIRTSISTMQRAVCVRPKAFTKAGQLARSTDTSMMRKVPVSRRNVQLILLRQHIFPTCGVRAGAFGRAGVGAQRHRSVATHQRILCRNPDCNIRTSRWGAAALFSACRLVRHKARADGLSGSQSSCTSCPLAMA